jgi:dTMP kinase
MALSETGGEPRSGLFITFEGGEGAGKSTQIMRLKDRLEARGLEVVTTREPGGSPQAETIRTFLLSGGARPLGPLAETMLFAAARADHVAQVIRPALARGAVVLCDRFADSTRVYQGLAGAVAPDTIRALEAIAMGDIRPNLTLIFDLPAEIGLARAGRRRAERHENADRFEDEDLAYHLGIRNGFLALAAAEPERCLVIDAAGPPDQVEQLAWQAVADRLLGSRVRENQHE